MFAEKILTTLYNNFSWFSVDHFRTEIGADSISFASSVLISSGRCSMRSIATPSHAFISVWNFSISSSLANTQTQFLLLIFFLKFWKFIFEKKKFFCFTCAATLGNMLEMRLRHSVEYSLHNYRHLQKKKLKFLKFFFLILMLLELRTSTNSQHWALFGSVIFSFVGFYFNFWFESFFFYF